MSCLTFDSLNSIVRRLHPTHYHCVESVDDMLLPLRDCFVKNAFKWSLIEWFQNRFLLAFKTFVLSLMTLLIDCHSTHAQFFEFHSLRAFFASVLTQQMRTTEETTQLNRRFCKLTSSSLGKRASKRLCNNHKYQANVSHIWWNRIISLPFSLVKLDLKRRRTKYQNIPAKSKRLALLILLCAPRFLDINNLNQFSLRPLGWIRLSFSLMRS